MPATPRVRRAGQLAADLGEAVHVLRQERMVLVHGKVAGRKVVPREDHPERAARRGKREPRNVVALASVEEGLRPGDVGRKDMLLAVHRVRNRREVRDRIDTFCRTK